MAFDLSSISKTRRIVAPKICIYGPGKIGKSTTASQAPSSVGILTEDGCHNVDSDAFPICRTLDDVYTAISTLLNEDHEFKTVFLDSLDWLEPLLYAHVCQKNGWRDIESPGYGKGYMTAAEEWRSLLSGLDALRNERNMGVILIGHDQIKRFENPAGESFDTYTLKLHQRAIALVQEWADIIAFINYRTFTRKEDAGFNKKEVKGIGSGERMMHLEARPAFLAGNRFGLPSELPLSWANLSQSLNAATLPAHPQP